jgi:hypothetical protein
MAIASLQRRLCHEQSVALPGGDPAAKRFEVATWGEGLPWTLDLPSFLLPISTQDLNLRHPLKLTNSLDA